MREFQSLTVDKFRLAVGVFDWTRQITGVHCHHTYQPDHETFHALGGLKCVQGMWRYHTGALGWSDIAQHVTIDPDGMIWTGRDWNRTPASSKGFNGNSRYGPFMFEWIGDFETVEDEEHDTLAGAQLEAGVALCAIVLDHFALQLDDIWFHRELHEQWKTCPGNTVDKDWFVDLVAQKLRTMKAEDS